jgi:hypothetical protein
MLMPPLSPCHAAIISLRRYCHYYAVTPLSLRQMLPPAASADFRHAAATYCLSLRRRFSDMP